MVRRGQAVNGGGRMPAAPVDEHRTTALRRSNYELLLETHDKRREAAT